MDVIRISDLNRQFLFRLVVVGHHLLFLFSCTDCSKADIGLPKAAVAADFINNRIPGVQVTG